MGSPETILREKDMDSKTRHQAMRSKTSSPLTDVYSWLNRFLLQLERFPMMAIEMGVKSQKDRR